MVVKALLPFSDAPDRNTVAHQPLHRKGRLIVPTSDSVKHVDLQDIKFPRYGILTDLHDCIPLLHSQLIAGDTLFRKFPQNLPAALLSKGLAGNSLHRNIILFHLSSVRHTIEAINPVHSDAPFCLMPLS